MARQRDYRAEYARRVAKGQERAAREGRPFRRAEARGHRDELDPVKLGKIRQRARIARLRRETGVRPDHIRYARANGIPDSEIEQMLRDKKHAQRLWRRDEKDYGNDRWSHRVQWLPAAFFSAYPSDYLGAIN